MRMGAWAHALTYGAFAACVLLLRGGGPHRRPACQRVAPRVTRRVPEAAVAGLTACIVIAFASIAVAGPNVDVSFLRAHDGLGWVPAGLRADVDGLRDEIVTNELDAATECLSGDQREALDRELHHRERRRRSRRRAPHRRPGTRARPGRDRGCRAGRAQPSRVVGRGRSRSRSVTRSCSPSTGAGCRATSRSPTRRCSVTHAAGDARVVDDGRAAGERRDRAELLRPHALVATPVPVGSRA